MMNVKYPEHQYVCERFVIIIINSISTLIKAPLCWPLQTRADLGTIKNVFDI